MLLIDDPNQSSKGYLDFQKVRNQQLAKGILYILCSHSCPYTCPVCASSSKSSPTQPMIALLNSRFCLHPSGLKSEGP